MVVKVTPEERTIVEPFHMDSGNECLWRGSKAIKLRPKAFAVLNHLVGRRGQLVTKEELLAAVWPETFVGDAVLKVAIREIREALDDDPRSPRFIETAHRRGYRFIGQIDHAGQTPASPAVKRDRVVSDLPPRRAVNPSLGVVGRDNALSQMRDRLERMLGGQRQIVFVAGEAGIGKTALVDAFVRSISADRGIRIARGQCLEHYGTSEAYLPVLEAIGWLCRNEAQLVNLLCSHAPMWLLQLPSLLSASHREVLSNEVLGVTRERMLREMGGAMEALTTELPLVLILEDLHWSDYSTLDLLSFLASQRQPARLLLIGTYRTAELIVSGHPLKAVKQELLAKRQCQELLLDYLSEEAIGKYLSIRFPLNLFPLALAGLIHERTDGNPLFMVNAVDYLVGEGLIVERGERWQLVVDIEKVEVGVPDSIKQMIEKQIDRLDSEEQRTLEAASVAGAEFSSLAVAAGLSQEVACVETRCGELVRRNQFIQDSGLKVLPSGEAVNSYGFIHSLYQNVLYERMPASRRLQLHRRIAEEAEKVYGERAGEIAAELAMHFERGRDYKRAARYLRLAANNAIRRFAYREAVSLARSGLEALARLPDSVERAELELCLQLTLGMPLSATEGYAAPDAGSTYIKARELCQRLGEQSDVSEALWGLWTFYTVRAELGTAREIAEELLRSAERLQDRGLAMLGHVALVVTFMHQGEFTLALENFQKDCFLPSAPAQQQRDGAFPYALPPAVAMPCFAAWTLWFLGQPDQALERMQGALTVARELSEPHGLAHALYFSAMLHRLRGEDRLAQERADAAIAVSVDHGLAMYQAYATITRGWALIEQGLEEVAVKEMCEGLAALQATGNEVARPRFLALLAEALGKAGRHEEALGALAEALDLAQSKGGKCYLAELCRLKGELLLMQATVGGLSRAAMPGKAVVGQTPAFAHAEACFHQSITIAQQQRARSWELRATVSLARLYQEQSKLQEARDLLAHVYDGFTEGFDTADLRVARELLDRLSAGPIGT